MHESALSPAPLHRPCRGCASAPGRKCLGLVALLLLASCGGEQDGGGGKPRAVFTEVAVEAGIDFVHVNGAFGKRYFPETMGGGCAFLDYDGDGAQDILMVNSGYWSPAHRKEGDPSDTMGLYRNDGRGNFRNVTEQAGMDLRFYGLGVAVGDIDGDEDPDVVISGVGGNRLMLNEGGRFRDATEGSGLAGRGDEYNISAGFFDMDGDGDLDLFVCDYVLWTKEIDDRIGFRIEGFGRVYSPPWVWEGRHCHLYRNEGDGTFRDVSEQAGIEIVRPDGKPAGIPLGVTFFDLEGDGDLDVYVANDTVPNFFFRNHGDGTFAEVAEELGVAAHAGGQTTGAMGVDLADLDGRGTLAIGVGNWSSQANSLFVKRPRSLQFAERGRSYGIGAPSIGFITFGFFFFDYDLDGHLDVFQTNGGLDEEGHRLDPPLDYTQPSQLFRGVPEGGHEQFRLLDADVSGVDLPVVGRGAAFADIDGDGDQDILVSQIGRRAVLFRNDQATGHHWLRVKLVGRGMNTDAIGAWVELEAGGRVQRRQVMPARSYASSVELPVTFGLGAHDRVDALRIRWPDGSQQEVEVEGVDRLLVVRQGP